MPHFIHTIFHESCQAVCRLLTELHLLTVLFFSFPDWHLAVFRWGAGPWRHLRAGPPGPHYRVRDRRQPAAIPRVFGTWIGLCHPESVARAPCGGQKTIRWISGRIHLLIIIHTIFHGEELCAPWKHNWSKSESKKDVQKQQGCAKT